MLPIVSLRLKRKLLHHFWFSTAFTGVTLLYSVSLLSLTDSIAPSGCAGTVLAGMSRRLLKFGGGSVTQFLTSSAFPDETLNQQPHKRL